MEITIQGLSYTTTDTFLNQTLAKEVFHNEDFPGYTEGSKTNFSVFTKKNDIVPTRNNGNGVLTVPTREIGHAFRHWIRKNPIYIDERKLRFPSYQLRDDKDRQIVQLLRRPYLDPGILEEREILKDTLRGLIIPVDEVQFGIIISPSYNKSSEYSIEWTTRAPARLEFDYDRKAFRIAVSIHPDIPNRHSH